MLRSVLVGMDGSEYSTAALGIIDAPTISKPEPVPLGGSAYKVHRDANGPSIFD